MDNYDNSNNKFENEQYDRSTSIHNKDEIPKEYNGTWLVIDEFNRADIDKAFGQLFTALESMELKIPSDTKGKSFKVIPIPLDYRIIGTLNTADKHYLFSMSDALKRRFAFVEVSMPDRDEKDDEIYYALQNAFESMKNNEEFSEIVEIGIMPIINEKTEGFKQKLEIAYDVLDLCRAYKPLGTAILKSIYQTLLVAEKLKEKDAIDYALNANLIPQLETLDKTSLTLMYKFMFEDIVNYMQKDLEPENIEKYSKSFKAILEFIEFTPKSNNPNKKITLDDIVSDIRNDEMTNNVWNEIFNAVKEKRTKIGLIFEEDHLPFEMFQKSLFELTESESLL